VAQQQWIQRLQDVLGPHPCTNRHGQRLAGVLIQNAQHLVGTPVAEPVMYEVDTPDMVRMGRPEPDDRAVPVVETPALLMPLRHLQPFFTPQALNLLVVYPPALDTKQSRYLAVAITPVLLRQPDQGQPQGVVITLGRLIVQGTAGQADHPAGSSLRCGQLLTRMDNGLTKIPARQALGFR
jgi:hypothetical protein